MISDAMRCLHCASPYIAPFDGYLSVTSSQFLSWKDLRRIWPVLSGRGWFPLGGGVNNWSPHTPSPPSSSQQSCLVQYTHLYHLCTTTLPLRFGSDALAPKQPQASPLICCGPITPRSTWSQQRTIICFEINNTSETDVAPWCYKWVDRWIGNLQVRWGIEHILVLIIIR